MLAPVTKKNHSRLHKVHMFIVMIEKDKHEVPRAKQILLISQVTNIVYEIVNCRIINNRIICKKINNSVKN